LVLQAESSEAATPKFRRWKSVLVLAILLTAVLVVSLEAFPSYTYTFQAPSAVDFGASLNATAVAQNYTLKLSLSDTNFLPFPNKPLDNSIFRKMNLSTGPCQFAYPFGVALYQGRYTLENVSTAKQVEVFDTFSFYFCPAIGVGEVYIVGPFQTVTNYVDMNGYWTDGVTQHGNGFSEGVLNPFLSGAYTLVVADTWGHIGVLYFQVK
jgi:hypothetical protein